jgi:glycosidase
MPAVNPVMGPGAALVAAPAEAARAATAPDQMPEKAAAQRSIVVTGTVQTKAGAAKDWDPTDTTTQMRPIGHGFYEYTENLPEGAYYYKVSINGSWAENYGLNGNFDGANVQMNLTKPAKVTFYYNDKTHKLKDSTSYKMLSEAELPVLGGDLAKAEGDHVMRDMVLDKFYQTTMKVPAGTYQAIVAQKGQKPLAVSVTIKHAGEVTFYYDYAGKKLIADDGSIHRDKIVHDTWNLANRQPFEAIKAGGSVRLSIAVQSGDIDQAQLRLAKAKITAGGGDEYNPDFSAGTSETFAMQKTATEHGQDIWSVTLHPQESGIYGYTFLLGGTMQYGDDAKIGHTGEAVLRGAKPFQLTVYRADFHTPEWAKEAVVYQIFPDRFANGDPANDNARTLARGTQEIQHKPWSGLPANHSKTPDKDSDSWECNDFFGGDLAGITQKLDYLQGLGITAIYVNPIMNACSNHRYDAVDYGSLDPMLGTMKDFELLISEMNKRGMHLIMDGVFNHVGDDSIYFDRYSKYKWVGAYEYWSRIYDLMDKKHLKLAAAKAEAHKELTAEGQVFSPYHWEDWFDIYHAKGQDEMGPKYKYHDWQGYSSLVAFHDQDYPGSEQGTTVSSLGDYLLYGKDAVLTKWFREGLSGWRLDVAKEVPPGFWMNVRKEVKKLKTTHGDEPLLLGEIWQDGTQFLTGDQFDSVMNYKLSFALGDLYLDQGKPEAMDEELTILRQNYPKEALYDLMNIVDSHDTVRAIYKFGGGKESVAQAGRQDFSYSLGKARLKLAAAFLMGYPGMPTIYYGDEAGQYGSADPDCRRTYPWGKEDQDLISYYRQVIGVRNSHKALFAHGDVATLKAAGDIYAFDRTYGGEAAIVALNRGKQQQVVLQVPAFADGTVFHDELDGYEAVVQDGQLVIDMGENQARMMLMS